MSLKKKGENPVFYTPDFICRLINGELVVIEVKAGKVPEHLKEKYRIAKSILNREGFKFYILNGKEIPDNLVENAEFIRMCYAECQRGRLPEVVVEIDKVMSGRDSLKASELCDSVCGSYRVYVGLAVGRLQADISKNLIDDDENLISGHGSLSHLHVGFV